MVHQPEADQRHDEEGDAEFESVLHKYLGLCFRAKSAQSGCCCLFTIDRYPLQQENQENLTLGIRLSWQVASRRLGGNAERSLALAITACVPTLREVNVLR